MAAGLHPTSSPARELAGMNAADLRMLRQRLIDAGCMRSASDSTASLEAASRECPDQDAVLRIETGMHVAPLSGLSVDAECRVAATGSDDKTVRLWSMPSGRLLRVLRFPIGAGDGGKVASVAVSPDGRWVAAGLDDAHLQVDRKRGIYIFDAATGDRVRRIGAIDDAMAVGLSFSPDGRRLAAAMYWGGVRVFDVETGALLMSDLPAPRFSYYAVSSAPDGVVYAVGDRGTLARIDPIRRRVAHAPTSPGRRPITISLDPSGQRIAVGYADGPSIDIFDARTLRRSGSVDPPTGNDGDIAAIAWSGDGRRLFGGGSFAMKVGDGPRFPIFSWSADGHRLGAEEPTTDGGVRVLARCGDSIAYETFDSGFGLIKPDNTAVELAQTRAPNMEYKLGGAFAVSADGERVHFGLGFGAADPVVFDSAAGTIADSARPPPGFLEPRTDGLPVKNWKFSDAPTFEGRRIPLEQNDRSFALAIRRNLAGFVLGSTGYVRAFDGAGRELWKVSGPGGAYGLNWAAEDKLLLVAYSDGTIRWLRGTDGRELLALFVDAVDRRWVAWTPSGYYMASPGGEDLIGWHVNRGWEQQADFFPASRFRDRFNRPDVVRLVLTTLDEAEAVDEADRTARRRPDLAPVTAKLPPVVQIEPPPEGGRFSRAELTLGYRLRSPSGLPIDRIDIQLDGRAVKEVGLPLKASDTETEGALKLALPARDVVVSLIAWSGDQASVPAETKMIWTGAPADRILKRKLRALIAGVGDYADPGMALEYAAKDARDFDRALQDQRGLYYEDVETRVLVDRDVTRSSLIAGLEWLEKQPIGPNDVSVLYLSGHGLSDERQTYWFLPSDATADDVRAKGVSQDEVRRSLQDLPGKVLWFLDTCHAAGASRRAPVDVNTLVNTVTSAESGGIVAFASSTGRETSFESSAWGNGAFTKAIVEGIEQGKADLAREGTITTSELDFYLSKRVRELTDDKQHPVMGRPPQEPDFTIAMTPKK
jgi:hypothetical protein